MDPTKIALAVSSGVVITCATCTRYWEGRDRGLPEFQCTTTKNCGSPIAGDVFSDYNGPITDFSRFCYVCGNQATYGVRVKNLVRVIGSCSVCLEMIKTLQPIDKNTPTLRFFDKTGKEVTVENQDSKLHLKLI